MPILGYPTGKHGVQYRWTAWISTLHMGVEDDQLVKLARAEDMKVRTKRLYWTVRKKVEGYENDGAEDDDANANADCWVWIIKIK